MNPLQFPYLRLKPRLVPALLFGFMLAAGAGRAATTVTVAADGSAAFTSVQAAIMSVPSGSATNPVTIRIRPGMYRELIYVQREKSHFRLVGENATNTILTFNLYAGLTNFDGKPLGTFHTPSTTVDADDFSAENLTFENTAGPVGQALAIRLDGDRAEFRHCRFLGCQDTILVNRGRDYFFDCDIAGTVDFIFGAGTAWFERCRLRCINQGYITAASTPAEQAFGLVFDHCTITGIGPEVRTYLGRPWRVNASTIWLNTTMSEVVRPEGWNDWKKPEAHTTARYAEYGSTGPGANPANRAGWAHSLTAAEAARITVQRVLGGADHWNPAGREPAPAILRRDVVYGVADGKPLLLDASAPAGDGPFPVVLIIHGGGWGTGDKAGDIVPLLGAALTNFTWFSMNYRFAPAHRWPACYEDVQKALRWVRAQADEYKGDPARIALIGYSAGGQLAAYTAVAAAPNESVQAVVGLAPPTDIVEEARRRGTLDKWSSMRNLIGRTNLDAETISRLAALSPAEHLHPGLPPFLLVQGDGDKTVPPDLTRQFQARLRAQGGACDLFTVTNGTHRLADWPRLSPGLPGRIAGWLADQLGPVGR